MESTCVNCGGRFVQVHLAPSQRCPLCGKDTEQLETSNVTPSICDVDAGAITAAYQHDAAQHRTSDFVLRNTFEGSSLSLNLSNEPLPVSIGRFQVRAELGRGGYGVVYLAFDPVLDREVALKVPRLASANSEVTIRFLREAKATARLQHPNIVALFDCGEAAGCPYLATEFVHGETLSARMKTQEIPVRVAVDWVRQIAEALHYAHQEGIVHRDVKPGNVMINRSGRPQIMDFGLAKREMEDHDSKVTTEGDIVGTPAYMAPEQARGAVSDVGQRSDQYSLGVVLYELLTGVTPYTGSVWSILPRVADVNDHVPPLRVHRPDISQDLEACCLKSLEKLPTARYESMQAFADDLDHWLKGLPLIARPLGPFEQLQRWCRTNRTVASLLGALAALILAAGVVGYVLAYQFQNLAANARQEAKNASEARLNETAARLETEATVINTYDENGFVAARANRPAQAALWFAMATATSDNHPVRQIQNRRRVLAWLSETPLPTDAFHIPNGSWNSSLQFHPSGRYLLAESASAIAVRDVASHSFVSLPTIGPNSKALWSPTGSELAIATGADVSLLSFPMGSVVDRWTHPDSVSALAFNADGSLLAVGGTRQVQIRDVVSQRFRCESADVEGHVQSVSFDSRSRCIAIGTKKNLQQPDGQIRVFAIDAGALVLNSVLDPQPSRADGMVIPFFVGDDRLVITDSGQSLRCWDLVTQKVLWNRPIGRILACAASSDGKYFAAGEDNNVLLINTANGEQVGETIRHRNLVYHLSFNPAGTKLAVSYYDKSTRIYDVSNHITLRDTLPHQDIVNRCVWAPDGNTVATVHWGDLLIRTWRLRDRSADIDIPLLHSGNFTKLNRSLDRCVPAGFDGTRDREGVRVYDSTTGQPVGPEYAFDGLVSDADFVPDTNLLIIVGSKEKFSQREFLNQAPDSPGVVRFVDGVTRTETDAAIETPSQPIAVACSPNGQTSVVLCHQGQVLLIDNRERKIRTQQEGFRSTRGVYGFVIRDRIRFTNSGDVFAIWGSGGTAEIRSTSSGELISPVSHGGHFIHDAQFSPDGTELATCSSEGTVRIWNSRTGSPIHSPLMHAGWIFSAQYSADGKSLLTASADQQMRLWDIATGKTSVATTVLSDQVYGVCFLPKSKALASVTRDGLVELWDATDGKALAPSRRMSSMAFRVAANAGETKLLVSGRDLRLKCIDLAAWMPPDDPELTGSDARLLGEILSSQFIHTGGAETSLTTEDWISRWTEFVSRYPQYFQPKSQAAHAE